MMLLPHPLVTVILTLLWMVLTGFTLGQLVLGVLAGLWLHLLWLAGPGFGAWSLLSGALGLVAVGGAWTGLVRGVLAPRLRRPAAPAREGLRHG